MTKTGDTESPPLDVFPHKVIFTSFLALIKEAERDKDIEVLAGVAREGIAWAQSAEKSTHSLSFKLEEERKRSKDLQDLITTLSYQIVSFAGTTNAVLDNAINLHNLAIALLNFQGVDQ